MLYEQNDKINNVINNNAINKNKFILLYLYKGLELIIKKVIQTVRIINPYEILSIYMLSLIHI